MKSDIPKQFICLVETPILMRTISVFKDFDKDLNIVLVLPKEEIITWQKLCEEYSFTENLTIAEGGATRFYSVKNGLDKIHDSEGLIAVHDAVRPLITKDVIERIFNCAEKNGAAIPCVHPHDSIRILKNDSTEPLNRDHIYFVQTPQCFQGSLLKKAYLQPYSDSFTDDATVVENLGEKISIVEGSRENFKITMPEDLILAEALLKMRIEK